MEQEMTNGKVLKRGARIDLRASIEDEENLRKAATKLGTTKMTMVIFESVKQLADGTPDLFFCNRVAIRDVDNNINAGQKLLQAMVDEFKKVLPGVAVTITEIQNWFGKGRGDLMVTRPEMIREFIIDKLFEAQQNRYPDLQFSRENVIVPDLTGILEAASKLIEVPEVNLTEMGIFWSYYGISENKIITLPDKIEEVKSRFRCFAGTPEERSRLSKVRELCQSLTAFSKDIADPTKLNIPNVCHFDAISTRFEPSEFYVLFNLK